MFLKTYSFAIMCFDCSYFFLLTFWAIFQSFVGLVKPPVMKSVSSEIAVIVGSSRGVGREIAFQLAELGATVVCVDINTTGNEKTVKQIKSQCGSAFGFTCDVTNKFEVSKTVEQIEEQVGEITMLFHCCGVPSPRSLVADPIPIQTTLDVSVISHFWLLDEILPILKKQCHGHIVLLTSVAGLSGIKHQMPLSVSQFAVQGIFESLTEELRLDRYHNVIHVTIAHIYPFIVSEDLVKDIRLRIPSYFGTISSINAATQIINGVRRNYLEISLPGYLLYFGHILKLLPRRAAFMLRELLDTGVDFG